MNRYLFAVGQNGFSTRDEIRSSVHVVCPKPRRLGVVNPSCANNVDYPTRSLRRNLSHQVGLCDSRAATELLDIILAEGGGGGVEQLGSSQIVESSPPFFCGSPPSRVANPLIQDVRFGDEKLFSPLAPPPGGFSLSSPPNSSSARKGGGGGGGGFVRANFGNNPVVRIEGFDCLDRDRRSCSIPALA